MTFRRNGRLGLSRSPLTARIFACAMVVAFCLMFSDTALQGQGLPAKALLEPPTTFWPTYNGDYSGRRYSTLKQINASNVNSLTLAWLFSVGNQGIIKSTPLEVNGILYFTVPGNVWAIDARTGREIWHYYRKTGLHHPGHRGVGMWHDRLYFTTADARLVCLDAKDGKPIWIVKLADADLKYYSTMAPLVVRNHVIVGVSGDVTDIPGFLDSIDPVTGKLQWRWWVEPLPGQPGSNTWPNADAMRHGGGMTWMPGTYDPRLNLLYWGTGNPNPVLVGRARPGANLYTCSIVALDPDTGKLVWYYQTSPHDVHDWDSVETPVIFDGEFDGKPMHLLAQAARNGFFFLLDRTNGKHLLTAPFIDETWSSSIDAKGHPIPKPHMAPSPDGTLVEPATEGATNWMAPSFDPQTGLFYVTATRTFSLYYLTARGKAEGWGGNNRGLWSDTATRAIDYRTGKIAWTHGLGRGGSTAGNLSTAGRLLFTADNSGNLLALDPATGKTLWHLNAGGRMANSPMTYMLDGRQYVVVAADGRADHRLMAFALPETAADRSARPRQR